MFEKEKRFSFKKGLPKKVISSPYYTLRFGMAMGEIGTNAVVVSKKVSKKAVERNRIKRMISSILKRNLMDKSDTTDIVLYIKPGIIGVDEAILEKELIKNIEKI